MKKRMLVLPVCAALVGLALGAAPVSGATSGWAETRAKPVTFTLDTKRVEGTSGESIQVEGRVTGLADGAGLRLFKVSSDGTATPVARSANVSGTWSVTIPDVELGTHRYRIATTAKKGATGSRTFNVTGFNWFGFGNVAKPWNRSFFSLQTQIIDGSPLATQWYRNRQMIGGQRNYIGNGSWATLNIPAGCTRVELGGLFTKTNENKTVANTLQASTRDGEFLKVEYTSLAREGRGVADIPNRQAFSVTGYSVPTAFTTDTEFIQYAGGQAYCPFAWPSDQIRGS